MAKISLKTLVKNDKYTQYIYDNYDLKIKEEVRNEIPVINQDELKTFNWNIGIIVGESGGGKTVNLRQFGEIKTPTYDNTKPICSQFLNLSETEVAELLHGVGLSSVPFWLQTPNTASVGQKSRLDIAWQFANAKDGEIVLIDEFTSTTDRFTSKSLAYSIQRYIRKHNLKVIFASCHYDIIEDEDGRNYLQPDWVFNLNLRNENNECELEKIIYSDDTNYNIIKKVNDKDILSNERSID